MDDNTSCSTSWTGGRGFQHARPVGGDSLLRVGELHNVVADRLVKGVLHRVLGVCGAGGAGAVGLRPEAYSAAYPGRSACEGAVVATDEAT